MAPLRRTVAGGQTGFEHPGAKTAMTLINVVGRERLAILASWRNAVLSLPLQYDSNHLFWRQSS
jgi:hypothetical protein